MSEPENRRYVMSVHPWIWCIVCAVLAGLVWYVTRGASDLRIWTSVAIGVLVLLIKAPAP